MNFETVKHAKGKRNLMLFLQSIILRLQMLHECAQKRQLLRFAELASALECKDCFAASNVE